MELTEIGWREWVALPDLGLKEIKAKADTGARTSSLHAFHIRIVEQGDKQFVHFKVHPYQRDHQTTVDVEAEMLERRYVKNSGGEKELRPVIVTTLQVGDKSWEIELTLTNRSTMGFRMLLGRKAMHNRVVIDPGRSFLLGKRKKKKAKRTKKKAKR